MYRRDTQKDLGIFLLNFKMSFFLTSDFLSKFVEIDEKWPKNCCDSSKKCVYNISNGNEILINVHGKENYI